MNSSKLIIIGAGGHAKVIIDIIRQTNEYEIAGLIGTTNEVGQSVLGVPVIGTNQSLPILYNQGITNAIIAIGNNRKRMTLASDLHSCGFRLVNVISPHAFVSPFAHLTDGIVILPRAVVNADARIMENVIINTNSSVDHDCLISAYSHICPGCSLAGGVKVGEGTLIGTGTSVIPGISIGVWSIIGAGSVVIRNLPDHIIAHGVPAFARRSTGENENTM